MNLRAWFTRHAADILVLLLVILILLAGFIVVPTAYDFSTAVNVSKP